MSSTAAAQHIPLQRSTSLDPFDLTGPVSHAFSHLFHSPQPALSPLPELQSYQPTHEHYEDRISALRHETELLDEAVPTTVPMLFRPFPVRRASAPHLSAPYGFSTEPDVASPSTIPGDPANSNGWTEPPAGPQQSPIRHSRALPPSEDIVPYSVPFNSIPVNPVARTPFPNCAVAIEDYVSCSQCHHRARCGSSSGASLSSSWTSASVPHSPLSTSVPLTPESFALGVDSQGEPKEVRRKSTAWDYKRL